MPKHKPHNPRINVATTALATWLFTAATSCSTTQTNSDATDVINIVAKLRLAANDQKRQPLEQLRNHQCRQSDVCDTRRACLEAYEHHVRGTEIGATLKQLIENSRSTEDRVTNADQYTAMLIEMNVEVEEARMLMPVCDQHVAELSHRIAFR